MNKQVRVNITDENGVLLDSFTLCHWKLDCQEDDQENWGSHAANSLLVERMTRYLEVPK